VRLTLAALSDHVADLAELAERYGIVLENGDSEPLAIETEPDGAQRFAIVGFLPEERRAHVTRVEFAEKWRPSEDGAYERSAYRYELLDHERDFRRAFHRHDDPWFQRHFGVVVHEHCESPIGRPFCAHHFGPPIHDGYRAIELLMTAWVSDPPDCAALPCLEPI
jgi:hypothetical protein